MGERKVKRVGRYLHKDILVTMTRIAGSVHSVWCISIIRVQI